MKAHFISDAVWTKRPIGAELFQISKPLEFYSAKLGRAFTVPVGFETDFASIPWFLQSVIQVNGPHIPAAVLHDYLCVHKVELGISQVEADAVFLEAMRVLDVRFTQRRAMYRAVRTYQTVKGWFS